MKRRCLYALTVVGILLVATSVSLYSSISSGNNPKRIDFEPLMRAYDYLRSRYVLVNFSFGTLVREYPVDPNVDDPPRVLWLNDAWLVAKALAMLFPEISANIMRALEYFNYTEQRFCVIFGDVENFAGPFGMKALFKANANSTERETYEIWAYEPDRDKFMPDFARYVDHSALAVIFNSYASYDWKAMKVYEQLKGMWRGRGLADVVYEKEGHFDTYKLALALIAAQLMDDYPFADKLAEVILRNQYTLEGKHKWGFITHYEQLGEPMNELIPTNVETTALSLIAFSPFVGYASSFG